MMEFAENKLGYHHNKGLDFVGRFNGQYVIGEAKFLTDFGGHQNAQFNDAIATVESDVRWYKLAPNDMVIGTLGNDCVRDILEPFVFWESKSGL